MSIVASEEIPLRTSEDILHARQSVRARAIENGFSLVDQTKLITAASELARNTVTYGRGGRVTIEVVNESGRRGVRLTFEDQGPGIPDVNLALKDGYTTSGGLGLGLGGARRLAHEFHIESEPGKGTRVIITSWKSGL